MLARQLLGSDEEKLHISVTSDEVVSVVLTVSGE
jgi:hypothetical protein